MANEPKFKIGDRVRLTRGGRCVVYGNTTHFKDMYGVCTAKDIITYELGDPSFEIYNPETAFVYLHVLSGHLELVESRKQQEDSLCT